jgi:tryptophan-rich sensory protein
MPSGTRDWLGLAGFVVLCLGVSGIGGAVTSTSVGTWYQTLERPVFNPPDWVFAPVWTALYLMMAVAGWRVWRAAASPARRAALLAFGVQLALNLAWSFLFFGFRWIGAALVEIVALLAAIAITTSLFLRVDRPAALLFVPYLLWVAYATALNAALWLMN